MNFYDQSEKYLNPMKIKVGCFGSKELEVFRLYNNNKKA
jgi:hypothetical protein